MVITIASLWTGSRRAIRGCNRSSPVASILMDDKTYARPMDADVDPIAYFKKIRDANYRERFKANHPDHVVKKKAYDAHRKGA
jgi:hypothetical protein